MGDDQVGLLDQLTPAHTDHVVASRFERQRLATIALKRPAIAVEREAIHLEDHALVDLEEIDLVARHPVIDLRLG
jgi:hypothetical protein